MALLEVNQIVKSYGGIQALRGCGFSVEEGTVAGLIGPNGSGKTTIFNVITGYQKPDNGNVQYEEHTISGKSPLEVFALGIGRTFQAPRTFARLTLIENLKVPVVKKKTQDASIDSTDWALSWIKFVGLEQHAQSLAGSLSYGQRKLLEFAVVAAAEPHMILLDEPAGGVNPTMIETMARLIKEMNARGVTFLVVEHNMGFVMSLCHHVVVMHHGQVIASGEPSVIRQNQAVLDAYLGD